MKAILTYLASIALVVCLGFVALSGSGAALFVHEEPARVDTRFSKGSFTRTAPEMVVHHAHRLVRDEGPRVIVVGSSNAMFSLPAELLGAALPGYQVHNFSIPSSNVSMTKDVIDLILAGDEAARANTTIVMGIYFGLFRQDRRDGPGHPLRTEMDRYGLYGETERGYQPRLGFAATRRLTWTFEVARRYQELVSSGWKKGRWTKKQLAAPADENLYPEKTEPANDEVKASNIRKRKGQLGSAHVIASEQFEVLDEIVQACRERGVRLVIIDLAQPAWSRKELYQHYRDNWHETISSYDELEGVWYFDMRDAITEELMCDDAHALRSGAQIFTDTLVARLNEAEVLP